MKTVNSSKSQRVLEFVPSIRPSFLSVVLVLVWGCLWVKNEATNERLISLESRIYCVPCTKRGTIDNLDRMTFSPKKKISQQTFPRRCRHKFQMMGTAIPQVKFIFTLLAWMALCTLRMFRPAFILPRLRHNLS